MVVYLSDSDVRSLVSVDDAFAVTDDLFKDAAQGHVDNHPTTELNVPKGFFRLKAGTALGLDVYGFKAYGGVARAGRYLVFVYTMSTGVLEGIVEARFLTEIRTGAVSAVGTKYLANPGGGTLGIIGTGREARAQLTAMHHVRPLTNVKAYSRSTEKRETYAKEMTERLGVEVTAVATAEEAIRGMDLVVTITSTSEPVLYGAWLAEGCHVSAVGATTPERCELDVECFERAAVVAVEHMPQAMAELGEIQEAVKQGRFSWDRVNELGDIIGGKAKGRTAPNQITIFDTVGVGTEDVAIASYALKKARDTGMGTTLAM